MILITGASAGIGEACARIFAENKHSLFLIARRLDRLQNLQSELENQFKVEVKIAALDISKKEKVGTFAKVFANDLKKINVLVNNAGLAKGRNNIQDGKVEEWDVMWDTNVKGLLYITHILLPHFLVKKSGHIINLGSVAGRWAYPQGNIYAATKRAVSSLTESLRLDLLGSGIRVTELVPGMVETEFSVVRLGDIEKANAVYKGFTPLTARDVAEAAYWAFSRPAHVNIQEIVIYPTAQASTTAVARK